MNLLEEAAAAIAANPGLGRPNAPAPPWSVPAPANINDRNRVRAWAYDLLVYVDDYLIRQDLAELDEAARANISDTVLAMARGDAARGDYSRLRGLYPDLAPYLNPPRRGQGQWPRQHVWDLLDHAVKQVRRLRALRGRHRRRKDEITFSPEELVVAHYRTFKPKGWGTVTVGNLKSRDRSSDQRGLPRTR
jgi:hypothetical protein